MKTRNKPGQLNLKMRYLTLSDRCVCECTCLYVCVSPESVGQSQSLVSHGEKRHMDQCRINSSHSDLHLTLDQYTHTHTQLVRMPRVGYGRNTAKVAQLTNKLFRNIPPHLPPPLPHSHHRPLHPAGNKIQTITPSLWLTMKDAHLKDTDVIDLE